METPPPLNAPSLFIGNLANIRPSYYNWQLGCNAETVDCDISPTQVAMAMGSSKSLRKYLTPSNS